MTDYSEQGAIPVEDAAVDDPPTVDEVMERQREEFPDQAATSAMREPRHAPTDGSTHPPSGGDEDPLAHEPAEEHEG